MYIYIYICIHKVIRGTCSGRRCTGDDGSGDISFTKRNGDSDSRSDSDSNAISH